jgi:hypothetical protein
MARPRNPGKIAEWVRIASEVMRVILELCNIPW